MLACDVTSDANFDDNYRRTDEMLQSICDSLTRELINEAVKKFRKRLKVCVAAADGHFEHSQTAVL